MRWLRTAVGVVCSVVALHAGPAFAAPAPDSTSRTVWQTLGDDLSISVSDAGRVFTSPARFDRDQWVDASAVLIGTGALMAFDSTGRRWVYENKGQELDNLAKVGNLYGEVTVGAGIATVVYAGGLIAGKDKIRVTGRMLFESLLFSGAVTTVLKALIGRARPYTDEGAFAFHGPQLGADHLSLPSGHSTVAFAVSSVLATRLHNPMATILLYGLASITAGARIYSDKHWLSDTFLGAAIGTSIGYGVAHLHDEDGTGQQTWMITPSFNGITLTARL